ncbi:gp436 family protein [Phaeobacter inhibens]|uniref:gp436 family protein n=1 Tax=Phaeobacter inhibens TaxID=221822 RepID=UPI00076BB81B|nr:DUF1320 domain-containing protein [Phaeobacter inhibens]KXF92091.1 hypothetical protein AT574_03810 [Phaeobacter inhibens]WHP69926.1 DUF1320 domain-containing protein [Phaeobacter inhibens]
MAYTTAGELTNRYGLSLLVSLTDRGEIATGQVDQGIVARAVDDADAEIDGYLKGRYRLPLSTTPPLVAALSRQISIWNLHTFDAPEKIEQDYKNAIAKLKDIAKGVIVLDVAGIEPQSSGSSGVMVTDRERPLSADSLKGWI